MIDGYDHYRLHVNETEGEVSPLSRLRQSMSSERWEIRRAGLSSVLNKMFDLAPPLLIGAAVDVVVREDSLISRTGIDEPFQQLLFLAVATIVIWVGESFFQYLYQLQWRTIAQSVEHRLRLEAWEHVQKLEMTWFSIQPKGEVMSIINTATANGSGMGDGIATLAKNHGYTITSEEVYAHQDFLGEGGDLTDFELELISGGQDHKGHC